MAALTLLALVPAASAFQTRTPLEFFGPAGPGACANFSLATGTGDLTAAVGTGDKTALATAHGAIKGGTTTITDLKEVIGTFTVGESISGLAIPAGTTITAVGVNTLTISQSATGSSGKLAVTSGSKTISNLSTEAGSFAVGWVISGDGIPAGTTVTAVGANSLTLSNGVTSGGVGIKLTAGSVEVTNVVTDCSAFSVGQVLEGNGIADPTTVTAVDIGAGTLTLSRPPTAPGIGVQLTGISRFDGSVVASDLIFDQASDKLYVVDKDLHAFDAPANTPAGGAFPVDDTGREIAVDETAVASAGNIYLASGSTLGGVDSTGTPLGGKFPAFVSNQTSGLAVDSSGTIWVASDLIDSDFLTKFDSAGNKLAEVPFPTGGPRALVFDAADNLYVALASSASGKSGIWRFTPASGYTSGAQILSGSTPVDLAIDRGTGTIYAVQNSQVNAYDTSGALLHQFGIVASGVDAVAVDESTDRVYVIENGERVRVYGALAEFPDATATVQPATNVTTVSAELHATVDDNSALPTRANFQLSKDSGATWQTLGGGSTVVTPGGQTGLPISTTASNLQPGTDYLVRVRTEKGGGSEQVFSATESFQTIPLPPASAVCDQPAANVTATSAELECTLEDENEFPTNWRFQVSKDEGKTWTDTDVTGETAGNESGVVVSGTVEGLDPNTEYRFRLSTSKGPANTEAAFEGPAPFTTLLDVPILSGVGAYGVTDTAAHLAGEVNPRNAQTSYEFKYGTSPGSLDSSTPATEIPAGLAPVVVAQEIADLAPDTDYHFKLIATNGAGTAESAVETLHTRAEPLPDDHPGDCANEGLREDQGSVHLPDCRAYEMVTPPEKNFGDLGANGATAAWDGEAASFFAVAGFGDPPGQVGWLITSYLSSRGAGGWDTRWLNEPACPTFGQTTFIVGSSPNLDRFVIPHAEPAGCPFPSLDPAAPPGNNLYLADYGAEPPSFDLLPGGGTGNSTSRLGENPDQVVYSSESQQTPDAPAGSFDKLYEWNDGNLSLLSKDTSNVPFSDASSLPPPRLYAVSSSGARIFFHNDGEIYMRQLGSITYDVSESECSSSCGADSADFFSRATPDGSKALFTSAAKLTNDDSSASGQDLYLYTHSANPAANVNLTLLSKDEEPADGVAADVLGVIGMSEDGGTVFFVASGQLVAGEPTDSGPKVYRWQANNGSPTLEYLATPADAALSGNAQWGPGQRRITPDGEHLFLHTTSRLVQGADLDSDRDLYRWSEAAGWECLSCQLPGTPSAGDSPTIAFAGQPVAFSEDGERAFFDSADSLVPADENEGIADVYQWHEGTLSLISTGTGTQNSELLGAGRSGEDVFFRTFERLVGWDVDGNMDIYDARVEGGFPEPSPEPAPCDADAGACEGEGTSTPAAAGAGSAAFSGPGNPTAGGKKPRNCTKAARVARKQSRLAKRLRRAARRSDNPKRSKRLRRRGARFARAAKKNANRAKRCRRADRRAAR
jgi:hypothetical protein